MERSTTATRQDPATKEAFKGMHAEFMEFYAYYLKYTYRSEDLPWGILMIVLFFFMIILCTLMNGMVYTFYKTRVNEIVAFIYTILSFTDITVAFGSCMTAATLILYLTIDLSLTEMSYVNKYLQIMCYLTFFVSAITIRMSILLSTILTLVRTIMICNPFKVFKKQPINITILVVATLWVLVITGEVYVTEELIKKEWATFLQSSKLLTEEDFMNRKQNLYMWYYILTSLAGNYHAIHFLGDTLPYSVGLHGASVEDSGHIEDAAEKICGYFMFSVTFVIPSIIVIICLVIQACALQKSALKGVTNRNRDVTYTIILLAIIFLICNSATVIFCSIAAYTSVFAIEGTAVKDDKEIMTFYRLTFIFQQMLPLVNSTLNPMILIWRGQALKRFARMMRIRVKQVLFTKTVTLRSNIRETIM